MFSMNSICNRRRYGQAYIVFGGSESADWGKENNMLWKEEEENAVVRCLADCMVQLLLLETFGWIISLPMQLDVKRTWFNSNEHSFTFTLSSSNNIIKIKL